jgi:hypothetical protein
MTPSLGHVRSALESGHTLFVTACPLSANCCHTGSIRYRQGVLYTTGYTRNAIVHNGMLDQGTILLTQPLSTEELVLKISRAAPP